MNGGAPHSVLTASPGPLSTAIAEAWRFRSLLMRFAARDVTLRYRQTVLGVIWVILQPLMTAAAFALVYGKFANLPHDRVPYLVFALSGLVAWMAFSSAISKTSASLMINAALVSKVYFPRLVLPCSVLGTVILDALVGLVLVAVVMALTATGVSLAVLLLPVVLAGPLLLGLGLGLIGAALSARYRDVVLVISAGLQVLLLVSPVGYSHSAVPHSFRLFYDLNPMSGFLALTRWSLFGTASPTVATLTYDLVFTGLALLAGAWIFHRMQTDFADVL
ncbi:MAG: ABC transporter permease [Actinomycetota bacterium]|nr:ABC transporter permease [Actinomycetota bacterium]